MSPGNLVRERVDNKSGLLHSATIEIPNLAIAGRSWNTGSVAAAEGSI